MTWLENKKNGLNLKFKPKHTWISFKLRGYIMRHCWHIVASTVTLGVSQPSPLIETSSRDLKGVVALTETTNIHIFPYYGNTKSGLREWRKSSLSQVASSSEWSFHCILKNLIVLRLMTRCFWSKTLIRCLGYDKSASSGVTSGNMTSTGAFKHFSIATCGRCREL